jgi:hypothetical protein
MLHEDEIQRALRAGRVVPLNVPNPHGPLGLEQLAAAAARVRGADREGLSIPLSRETRAKLEQLARAEGQATARSVAAAEPAAAVVEQFVAMAPNGCRGHATPQRDVPCLHAADRKSRMSPFPRRITAVFLGNRVVRQ